MTPTFASLKPEYQRLWDTMTINADKQALVERIATKLLRNKPEYQAAQAKTGVPWFVIAAWHERESDADFNTQLAQGDPLNRKSTHVPAGRGPFKTWADGAFDALVTLKGLDRVTDWDPARTCYETERYNGFGYRTYHGSVLSPYLWSFSNHYTRGKYVADGRFSAGAVDAQCGAIPIIKKLMELDEGARFKAQPTTIAIPKLPMPGPAPTTAGAIVVGGAAAATAHPDPKWGALIFGAACVVAAIVAAIIIYRSKS